MQHVFVTGPVKLIKGSIASSPRQKRNARKRSFEQTLSVTAANILKLEQDRKAPELEQEPVATEVSCPTNSKTNCKLVHSNLRMFVQLILITHCSVTPLSLRWSPTFPCYQKCVPLILFLVVDHWGGEVWRGREGRRVKFRPPRDPEQLVMRCSYLLHSYWTH